MANSEKDTINKNSTPRPKNQANTTPRPKNQANTTPRPKNQANKNYANKKPAYKKNDYSAQRNERNERAKNTAIQLAKLYSLGVLQEMTIKELTVIYKELELPSLTGLRKHEIISAIMEEQLKKSGNQLSEGVLEILPDGYGFLRTHSYFMDTGDVYVSPSQIRRFRLRTGDSILGLIRTAKDGEKYAALLRIETINNEPPENARDRKVFKKLIPLFPDDKLNLEVIGKKDISCRIMDIFCPVGKGQRALIVAPPKAGKTVLIKELANTIRTNHPEVILMVLLIDERPEEVTDMKRSVDGEVISSTFDEPIERHMQVSKLTLEKAKRLVEMDKDVVILLDSITRLARAFNLGIPSTGQTLSGGVNPAALYLPKKFFGAARNIEGGGSLTIIATALVDTGSRLDDVIFEEFKGTGNMELILDRKLFDKRIFPCFDIMKSGTRREDLLIEKETLQKIWILRKIMNPLSPTEVMQTLIDRVSKTKTNEEFFESMHAQES